MSIVGRNLPLQPAEANVIMAAERFHSAVTQQTRNPQDQFWKDELKQARGVLRICCADFLMLPLLPVEKQ